MIVVKSLPPVVLRQASLRLQLAARELERDAGRIMAETMETWARAFLDRMTKMAQQGQIPVGPHPLSNWTLVLSDNKTYSYDTGKFWKSMEVRSQWGHCRAEVWIQPTGISSHTSGRIFPNVYLMAGLGHTDSAGYEIVIMDRQKVQKIMRWLYQHAGDRVPPPDEVPPKRTAGVIRVPPRPLIVQQVWEEEIEKLGRMLATALRAKAEQLLGGAII